MTDMARAIIEGYYPWMEKLSFNFTYHTANIGSGHVCHPLLLSIFFINGTSQFLSFWLWPCLSSFTFIYTFYPWIKMKDKISHGTKKNPSMEFLKDKKSYPKIRKSYTKIRKSYPWIKIFYPSTLSTIPSIFAV